MFPREHLPLVLVTVALLGMIFIMYRELNALKSAVAHLSVPLPATLEEFVEEEEQEDAEDQLKEEKKNDTPALESSKKTKRSS